MPNIGPTELIVVLVVALLILGPKRLPEVGRSLGRGIGSFRRGLTAADIEPPVPAAAAAFDLQAIPAADPREAEVGAAHVDA